MRRHMPKWRLPRQCPNKKSSCTQGLSLHWLLRRRRLLRQI